MLAIPAKGNHTEIGAINCVQLGDGEKPSFTEVMTFAISNRATLASNPSSSEQGPFYIVRFAGEAD
ncbi:hypothetical protein KKF61_05355 [Patescibacteria group bacterium]|nr:hypothetical protein [Patescibacteria group bacterium]MBU0964420.1 hypothetical protein [Patescibacteria group bacterium]